MGTTQASDFFDDVVIHAQGSKSEGPEGSPGRADPNYLRSNGVGWRAALVVMTATSLSHAQLPNDMADDTHLSEKDRQVGPDESDPDVDQAEVAIPSETPSVGSTPEVTIPPVTSAPTTASAPQPASSSSPGEDTETSNSFFAPKVRLLGDASAQGTIGGEGAASFGGGIQYFELLQELTVFVNLNAANTKLDEPPEFGLHLLTPAAVGRPAFQVEYAYYAFPELLGNADVGIRVLVNGATIDWTLVEGETENDISASVVAADLEVAGRSILVMDESNFVSVTFGGGFLSRYIAGNVAMTNNTPLRREALKTNKTEFFGFGFSGMLQINAFHVGVRIPVFPQPQIPSFNEAQLVFTGTLRDGPTLPADFIQKRRKSQASSHRKDCENKHKRKSLQTQCNRYRKALLGQR